MKAPRAMMAVAILLSLPRTAEAQHPQREPNPYEPGRTYTEWLLTGQTAPLWERLSPAVRSILGSEEALGQLAQQIRDSAGIETAVLEERFFSLYPFNVYGRRSSFSRETAPRALQWFYDASGTVLGVIFQPEQIAAAPFAGYQTRTPLRLPFSGEWQVSAGGNTLIENHHVVVGDQRFAYDITGVGENGLYTGEGSRNEDYAGFGRPILAPADGTVVESVDEVPDNVPGQVGTGHIAGNRIVIDHGNGEYSMMAHFRRGTIRVRQGDRVASGQELGQCGNSGNSTGPHLHYHLQNTPVWGGGDGLPAQFRD